MKAQDAIYDKLDYKSGSLFDAANAPLPANAKEWLNKGEWLSAAKKAGADSVFFVEDNPVLVFAECSAAPWEWFDVWKRMWSLARPRLLFLATGDTVSVIDLAQKPIVADGSDSEQERRKAALATLTLANVVLQEGQKYHRDQIESGKIFTEDRFENIDQRADKALIADLKTVRQALIDDGLKGDKLKYAHALIGRSIFVRYLEDRKIIDRSYFEKLAKTKKRPDWKSLLKEKRDSDLTDFETCYPKVLESKEFTYALFQQLAIDFNGDMFPDVDQEKENVEQRHLSQIRDLLYGNAGIQRNLFFQCYRFDIVPLDLISSIYEEFYHSESIGGKPNIKAKQDGAFYTPPGLAEFVLSRVLTEEVLGSKPRVLDPACGSGIFLVEAFKRILRYECQKLGRFLTYQELKDILTTQILGIEVNPEAARITAFSLYLSMLHQLDPPSILDQLKRGNRLPNLLVSEKIGPNYFNRIWAGNSFEAQKIENHRILKVNFGNGCADVVVGNPPWGGPERNAPSETKEREAILLDWCDKNQKPIEDKERSQAFLWRALDFLKEDGVAAMLVSSGILMKHVSKKIRQPFRANWLSNVRLIEVHNFIHVRHYFFNGAVSPFIHLKFKKAAQENLPVQYWSAKKSVTLAATQAVLFSKYDRQFLTNHALDDYLTWKVGYFGRHADHEFIGQLSRSGRKLKDILDRENCGQGYKLSGMNPKPFPVPPEILELQLQSFSRYDHILFKPNSVKEAYRHGCLACYGGKRILVKRGIDSIGGSQGQIVSRFEDRPFFFTSAIIGLKLKSNSINDYRLTLGLLWSSLARYYFFHTSSTWGIWHDALDLDDELLKFPFPLKGDASIEKEIIKVVSGLQSTKQHEGTLFDPHELNPTPTIGKRKKLEEKLDQLVFDYYQMVDRERDLVIDCCKTTIPFCYSRVDQEIAGEMAIQAHDQSYLLEYAKVFGRRWNPYFSEGTQVRAEAHLGLHGNMVAVEFFPADATDEWDLRPKDKSWETIIEEIGQALQKPVGTSRMIQDEILYAVSDKSIIVVKRNEKRFWTKSLAREDAEATLVKRMQNTVPIDSSPKQAESPNG